MLPFWCCRPLQETIGVYWDITYSSLTRIGLLQPKRAVVVRRHGRLFKSRRTGASLELIRFTRSGLQRLEGHQSERQMQGVASTNPEHVPSRTRLVYREPSVRYLE